MHTRPAPDAAPADCAEARDSRWGDAQRARERQLFASLELATRDSQEWLAIRNDIVLLHLPLVEYCARRFRDRGEPLADIVSIGTIGLIKSAERYDLGRGVEFSTFAMPTIIGEIKRHFRDRARVVRLPRRLIDVANESAAVSPQLQREMGREPQLTDIAERIGCTPAEVAEAHRSTSRSSVQSLDLVLEAVDAIGDKLPSQLMYFPIEIERLEWRCTIAPVLAELAERDRDILRLRFEEQLSQSAIAEQLGISQMHVSRLLNRTLAHLRACLADAA